MSDVQIAVIDQQDTQIVLAVPGVQGATGSSIPSGGTADQVLRKNSSTDYDANWTQVTSAMIANGTIVNEDINNSAAIAGTKISPDFGGQAVTTTGQINGARVNVTGNTVPSNGLYLPSANNVALSTSGTGKLFIDSAGKVTVKGAATAAFVVEGSAPNNSLVIKDTTGNVGIGTTSPSAKLHVFGTGSSSNTLPANASAVFETDGNAVLAVSVPSASAGGVVFPRGTDAYYAGIERAGTDLNLRNNGSTRATIDSSGRLLVGTSSVSGSTGTAPYARIQVQGNSFSSTTQGAIAIKHGSAPASIGANATVGSIAFAANNDGEYAWIDCVADGAGGTNDYPGRLVFSTTADGASSPTERMRITNGGEIQFGNTANGAYTVTRNPGICAYFDRRTSDGVVISFERQGSGVGNISVTTTATAYNTSSDYRLKENVTPVADGITRLQQLKPSRFNFIADPDKTVDGFIAHEVQTIVPEAITGEKDAVDDEGNPVYQGIDQSKLVPLLTAALQEAIAKIETLEAKVAALEGA